LTADKLYLKLLLLSLLLLLLLLSLLGHHYPHMGVCITLWMRRLV